MNDFAELWKQQMEEPKMREMMEATNDLIGRPQDGYKRLVEMNLSEDEKNRILRIMNHPHYKAAEDAVINQVLGKNRWIRWYGSIMVKKYKKEFTQLV